MPLTLFAAALAGPSLRAALDAGSYPLATLTNRHAGAAVLTLVYDPQGRLESCAVEAEAGSGAFGATTCAALRRPTVEPARLADGAPAWSRVRVLVRFFANDGHDAYEAEIARLGRTPDLELTARGLPARLEGSGAEVAVAADVDGRVQGCVPVAAGANPDLARAACAGGATMALPPLVLADGRKVPFVSTLLVKFVRAP